MDECPLSDLLCPSNLQRPRFITPKVVLVKTLDVDVEKPADMFPRRNLGNLCKLVTLLALYIWSINCLTAHIDPTTPDPPFSDMYPDTFPFLLGLIATDIFTFEIGLEESDDPSVAAISLTLSCRCGVTSNIRSGATDAYGDEIQCQTCYVWSHHACQTRGISPSPFDFICEVCEPLLYSSPPTQAQYRRRQTVERKKRAGLSLQERLQSGKGGLARHGDYWYPVRLVREVDNGWVVKWWQGNVYKLEPPPGQVSFVSSENLVDSLWKERAARRKVRLGQWQHAHDAISNEDILSDPSTVPFTPAVDRILSPWRMLLLELLFNEAPKHGETVPAKKWLQTMRLPVTSSLVPYTGSLTILERAQIANWFELKVSLKKNLRVLWLGLLPIAHAFTIYIAYGIKAQGRPEHKAWTYDMFLERAWEIQFAEALPSSTDVDVDKESLEILEEDMFEVSTRAGVAGHYQWGLDVGRHQNWDPYCRLPEGLNHGNREGHEEELETGPDFKEDPDPKPRTKARPRPTPISRKRPQKVEHEIV